MAFAAKLVAGKYKPNMCSQVRAEGNEKMREELENIYLTLGYAVFFFITIVYKIFYII